MNVLIIEDEAAAVTRLRKMLVEIDPTTQVVADVPTIRQAVEWIKNNPAPDLSLIHI